MSSFARTSALALLLASGCMRIYPDAELPDVVVDWANFECPQDVGDVHVEVSSFDSDELRYEATGPCGAGSLTIADVDRERYRVRGYLLDPAGEIYDVARNEADLRNGLSNRVEMYWSGYANLVVAWTFAAGATCKSLPASIVTLEQHRGGSPDYQSIAAELCSEPASWVSVAPGPFELRLRAFGLLGTTVAISEPVSLDVAERVRTDAGTLVLAPCGASCPLPPGI
ncbi:MAG: hypothetical protein SFX73_05415 [Kofleriaceae bacterium]|nr:hypothetical protein [Kofleriaceae bacterium]